MEIVKTDLKQLSEDYRRIERAIEYLERNYQRQPSLEEVAKHVYLSEYHFQRLFKRWVGISPKRFLQFMTKERAKQLLDQSASVLEATYAAGLSSPGRLHDLFVNSEAVTPGEYKRYGEGLTIHYGFHPSPFGEFLLARTDRGISDLIFLREDDRDKALEELHNRWKFAEVKKMNAPITGFAERIFGGEGGESADYLPLHLIGTNFQLKVWEALMRIPSGTMVSYQDLAVFIGMPSAARAVGNAVASNPIPVLIPCHRVIPKSGDFGKYRWGGARKKAMLVWEMARQENYR